MSRGIVNQEANANFLVRRERDFRRFSMTSVRSPVSMALELATARRMLARDTDTLPELFLRTMGRLRNKMAGEIITLSRHTVPLAFGRAFTWQLDTKATFSSKSELLSSKLTPLSSNPELQSGNPDQEARDTLFDQLPGNLAARIGALGQRHPPEQVRDLVVALCEQRDWRVEELALLLSRNAETIRQNYLRPLLAEKRIVMTLPDTPNSPQQAYRAAREQD